jgi:CheY-like chemotaxis protein
MTFPYDDLTRIMLVDDDHDEENLFISTLKQLNFPHLLYYAWDTATLFRMLSSPPLPHLIFLDINMPVINGLQCLQQLKQTEFRDIPVIMYSISSRMEDIDACYETGAHHYIIKPHAFSNFKATITQAFSYDWRIPNPPKPKRDNFLINISYTDISGAPNS